MNERVRSALTENNFRQWQLAEFLHVSEWKLSRTLSRHELSEIGTQKLLEAISQMAKIKSNTNVRVNKWD